MMKDHTGKLMWLREEMKHPASEQQIRISGLIELLRKQMGHNDFMTWWMFTSFNDDELEQELRDKLQEVEQANNDQEQAEAKELAMLRRIHGYHLQGVDGELERLRKIHEKWAHPARSDRGRYTQLTPYWIGDLQ